jgi:hypothetical protein
MSCWIIVAIAVSPRLLWLLKLDTASVSDF